MLPACLLYRINRKLALSLNTHMAAHFHRFVENEWPFKDAVNTAAFTTTRVVNENYPVLLVTHEADGDWQILCGTTKSKKDRLIICLGCAFENDRSIGEVADLPLGWKAWRTSRDSSWQRAEDTDISSSTKLTQGLRSIRDRFLRLRGPVNE
jgi:hypothetical protein